MSNNGSSNNGNGSRYHVPNLERALAIMELLARHPDGLGASDIVETLKLPKNSVFRITMTLLNHGYLTRDQDSKRFILTRKLLALGYAAMGEHNIVEKALDIMRQLRDDTRETVLIATLTDAEGVVLEQVPGLYPFKFSIDAGMRFPLHTGAPGKAILAYLPESEQEDLIQRIKLTRYTDRTITRKKEFRDELRQVRRSGYAVDRAEQVEGVHCISAPVFDRHGYPVAAIWATGPSERLSEREFETIGLKVKEHAERISRRLGFGLL